jgi:hypothetical protein
MRIKPRRKQSRIHLALVAAMPCIVCGSRPVEVHHLRNGYGMGQRASDLETIPLCPAHHRTGPDAFHAGPRSFEARFGTERELLARTRARLEEAP